MIYARTSASYSLLDDCGTSWDFRCAVEWHVLVRSFEVGGKEKWRGTDQRVLKELRTRQSAGVNNKFHIFSMSEIRMDQRSDASEEHGTLQTCNVIVTHNNLRKSCPIFTLQMCTLSWTLPTEDFCISCLTLNNHG